MCSNVQVNALLSSISLSRIQKQVHWRLCLEIYIPRYWIAAGVVEKFWVSSTEGKVYFYAPLLYLKILLIPHVVINRKLLFAVTLFKGHLITYCLICIQTNLMHFWDTVKSESLGFLTVTEYFVCFSFPLSSFTLFFVIGFKRQSFSKKNKS